MAALTYFDPGFKIHTSHHNNFFVLRTPIHINDHPIQIGDTGQGPILSFDQSGVTISNKLWEISRLVGPIFVKYGVYHVDTFYYEQVPLFQVAFPSEDSLHKFLLASDAVRSEVESALSGMFTQSAKSSKSDKVFDATAFKVQAKVELFLVSPSHEKNKATNIHSINLSNFSFCSSLWKNSELFEFGHVFAMYFTTSEEAESPQISTQPQDQAETVTMAVFTIQATGTEPLFCSWEWKPQGHDEWKALSNNGDEVQGADTATLTIENLQKSHEGHYRCTVTNSAGRVVSESASLTLADPPEIVSHPEDSRDVVAEKKVTFTVQATGTQPLSCRWDSKPTGRDWQPLPGDGDKIQGVEMATLTITSVQKSHEGSYRCTVTNCAGSEVSDIAELTVVIPVELRDLLNELQDVDDWFHLGIYLKIRASRLREIQREYQTVTDRKITMLDDWGNQVVPTWAGVVQALVGMGRTRLATEIGTKYGVSVPDYVENQPSLEQRIPFEEGQVVEAQTFTEIKRIKEHVRELDELLRENEEELKDSAASQEVASENLSDINVKLSEVQGKVQRLVHEKNSLQTKLKHNERELMLLQEMKDMSKTQLEWEKEKEALLQRIIDEKKEDIKTLREELQAKEAQLQPLYQEVNTLRVELAGKTAELLAKTDRVHELEKEKDQLISTCNSERSRTDMLVQQITAQAKSHEAYSLEIKQQLSDMTTEKESKAQQLEDLTAKTVQLEGEIGGLSAALEERESVVRALQVAQKDDGEKLLKISAMEQEIAELKVKLVQVQNLKEQKQRQRAIMLQDEEKVENDAVQLHTLLGPGTSHSSETDESLPNNMPTDPEQQPSSKVYQPWTEVQTCAIQDHQPVIAEELVQQPKPELHPRGLDYTIQLETGYQVRNYQWELATPGIRGVNYIICAPTGTGKTLVAALVISDHLQKRRGKGKVIFIVNTRPLAQQQKEALQKIIQGAHVECCVGEDFTTTRTIQILLPHKAIIVCTAGKFLDELRQNKVHFNEISLIVFDECHHTRKNDPYAEIMGNFHEEKQEGTQMPQVVGMTASPGAGTRLPELDKVIDHLVSLCALLDASGGIKRVTKYVDELNQYTNKPTFTLKVLKRRDTSEPLIGQITAEMQWLEDRCLRDPLKCPFNKWSQEYETSIQQRKQLLELSTNPDERDQISTLELLRLYSQALSVYMDLRYEDAMSVLNEYTPTPEEQASRLEKEMTRRLKELKDNISRLPNIQNPFLKNVEVILQKHFLEKPESKGIFFVRTKKHAHCITEWVAKLPGIRPCVITGHSRGSGPEGMTDVEKTQAIASFQDDKYNLLVATSVAEEGLDVPACNLVIRFQHVSNEIAKIQTRGRARAADSDGYTILSSDSRKAYQEMVNEELEKLIEEALQDHFPQGSVFLDIMKQRQKEIISERALKKDLHDLVRKTKAAQKGEHVQLKCKKCKVFACYGSDVYTVEESAKHYVVPNENFKATKINIKSHSKPKQISPKMHKLYKIYCAQCDFDWGVMCKWPSDGYEFPLLKCKSFIFEVNGIPRQVGKWSDAPFEILPLSSQSKYQGID